MKKTIYELVKECQNIIDNEYIIIQQQLLPIINGRQWRIPHYALWSNGNSEKLISLLTDLQSCISCRYPVYATELKRSIDAYEKYPPISLGGIETVLRIIEKLESPNSNNKRIFISHSSQNKELISWFVDYILQLGIGIDAKDIFCTSIEDMKIKNGDDIRKHIHDNIKSADFSFLIFSRAYTKSAICLNEMGAVWAYDNNVRYYLLPDFNFDEIGWLCNPKSAELLCDPSTLDSIQREIKSFYNLEDKGDTWSKQRKNFITQCDYLTQLSEI